MILPLLVSLIAFNPLQVKHLLIETEDNSEPMPKEEVEALLSVLPKEAKETYNNLNKTAKKAFQREIKTIYGDDTRVVRYTICIAVVFLLQLFTKITHLKIIEAAQNIGKDYDDGKPGEPW